MHSCSSAVTAASYLVGKGGCLGGACVGGRGVFGGGGWGACGW